MHQFITIQFTDVHSLSHPHLGTYWAQLCMSQSSVHMMSLLTMETWLPTIFIHAYHDMCTEFLLNG